jgi:hypothetical protein
LYSLCSRNLPETDNFIFGGHAASQFSSDSQSCCGTALFAPNPLPLKKRAAGFPLQSLARVGCRYDIFPVRAGFSRPIINNLIPQNPAIFGHEKFELKSTYDFEKRRVRPVYYFFNEAGTLLGQHTPKTCE